MRLQSITPTTLKRLGNRFIEYLEEQNVLVTKLGLVEEGSHLQLVMVTKRMSGEEKVSVFEFEKANCLGHEMDVIAKNIINPVLERLR